MRLLLDTSALIWWFAASPELPAASRDLIARDDAEVLVSAASAWEICTKIRIGKLHGAHDLCERFSDFLRKYEFEPLAISVEHARLAGRLPGAHKDPFDRMLAAQALIEAVPVVTSDPAIAGFGAKVIW